MKQIFVYILTTIIIFGCEPSYRVYVRNSSSPDLYIKIHPSIESCFFYFPNDSFRDSIIAHKVKQEGKYSIYKVKPNTTFFILGRIGGGPTADQLPFDYIALINGSDSMVLDNKEKIIKQAKLIGKKRNRNFYIEIENKQ
jgi:hypothetical protein